MNAKGLPSTEGVDPHTLGLDLLTTPALIATLVGANARALAAVEAELPQIARAVDAIADRLHRGGTLHYVGAGTSGRLAVLDAAECPPTFGTPATLVRAHIAGGSEALVRAVEGAEDDAEAGRCALADVNESDAVVGISASGGAPYVVAAIQTARARGAFTAGIANSLRSPLAAAAELAIELATGAEPLSGSTRLVAGTSQKLVLNALSTAVMVRLGKVYDNLMVDLVATNQKLQRRAVRLVRTLTGVDEPAAVAALAACGGSVKTAVTMVRCAVDPISARALLERSGGMLRTVLQ